MGNRCGALLSRFLVVLGFCGDVCARLYDMHVAMAFRAKALPDLVGADDGGAHGRHFFSLRALSRSPIHSIACGLILWVKT
jgi:hypothetical protein